VVGWFRSHDFLLGAVVEGVRTILEGRSDATIYIPEF
jgi:hypothetical protein